LAGDFNGDGKLDLAVANGASNNVSILLGNGNGTFQAPLNTAVGVQPIALAAADFNADGKLDLAVANLGVPTLSAGSFSVLIGNGDGTFQPQQDPLTNPGGPVAVVAADFNGDGNVDLVVANENSGTIAMLAGNGNGTFQPAVTFALIDPLAMIAADFDQDGILDLAVVSGQSKDLAIMTGDGHGNFAAPVFWNAGNDPVQLAAGNFNADKLPDLVVANFNLNSVSVLLNTSTPATK
jgi:hypothetical protein